MLFYVYTMHSVDEGTFCAGIDWQYHGYGEFSVSPRYNSLKEEMQNYYHLPLAEITKIFSKAKQYIQHSTIAKSLIRYGEPVRLNCLICIMMYCDYSLLSRVFTLSFRKRNQFELIYQIKKRNQKYYYWSIILKETIRNYGQCDYSRNGLLPFLKGPFYSGMSIVLNIP